jgi:hypothetical protein
MMRAMSQGMENLGRAVCIFALVGCGGQTKQADSPGTCPEGTVLRGSDCLPASTEKEKDPDEMMPSGSSSHGGSDESSPSPAGASGANTPYDKDAVEAELKRAARSVKASCGASTDEDGQATGPWGTTKASITLGRNGHIKQVTVPPPYDGKPVGVCVVHAFEKIWFPPYAGSTDAVVEWDVDIVKPKQ